MKHPAVCLLSLGLLTLVPAHSALAACEVEIEANDAMQYNKDTIEVDSSCETVTVTLIHTGDLPAAAMGHNWVLSTEGDFKDLAQAGASAGPEQDYLPPDDDRVIAATPIIGGGESASVEVPVADLDASQSYTFFCSFPGHWSAMNGAFQIN